MTNDVRDVMNDLSGVENDLGGAKNDSSGVHFENEFCAFSGRSAPLGWSRNSAWVDAGVVAKICLDRRGGGCENLPGSTRGVVAKICLDQRGGWLRKSAWIDADV